MNWELINEIVVDTPVEEIIITLPKKYRKICLYIDLCSETDTTYNINIKTDVDYEKIAVLNSALPKTGIGKRSVIYLAEKVAEKKLDDHVFNCIQCTNIWLFRRSKHSIYKKLLS